MSDGREDRTWLGRERRPGVATIGSLMVRHPDAVDEHGFPNQVLIEYDAHDRALDLLRDAAGRPLTWVLTPDGTDHVRDAQDRAALRPAPPEVAEVAEEWLREELRRRA